MHRLTTTFVLGYHGCDEAVAAKLVAGEGFIRSQNEYDWLGNGIYFWEANPRRALEFAAETKKRLGLRATITHPAVVGAIIDLRFCLDLSTSAGTAEVAAAYETYTAAMEETGRPLPRNRGGPDMLFRDLDRAVIEHLHAVRNLQSLQAFDTVRGFFFEGGRVFPGAGFMEKTHVQICVRELECIHGVFRVPPADLSP